MHVNTRLFFPRLIVLSILFMLEFSQITPVLPIERDIANKDTAQHRAVSSAQVALGIIKTLVPPHRGPLLSAPFTSSCTIPCASVACAERSPC